MFSDIIRAALREDIGEGDITSRSTVSKNTQAKARIIFKQAGVVCGLPVVKAVFKAVDVKLRVKLRVKEGSSAKRGRVVAVIEGPARSLLAAERTALNFLGQLSGIATLTRQFVDKVKGTKAKIYDTRKTTPLLRELEKYAVRTGGGVNHRMGLWDQVLVKENHLSVVRDAYCVLRKKLPKNIIVEIEVRSLKEFKEALKNRSDIIMLDNMTIAQVRKAVDIRNTHDARRNTKIEVSGGITLKNVRKYARTGAERISVGALTHSAPSIDVSMEIKS